MLHTVLRHKAAGEPVEQIRPDLIIPTGKRKGRNPDLETAPRWQTTGWPGPDGHLGLCALPDVP
jgi:hypothetical protein